MRNFLPLCLLLGACIVDEDLVDSVGSLTLEDARPDAYVSRPDGGLPNAGLVRFRTSPGGAWHTGRLLVEPGTETLHNYSDLVLTTIGALPPMIPGQCMPPLIVEAMYGGSRAVTAWIRHPTLNIMLLRLDSTISVGSEMPSIEGPPATGTPLTCSFYAGTADTPPYMTATAGGVVGGTIPNGYLVTGSTLTSDNQGAICVSVASNRTIGMSSWTTSGGVGLVALTPVRDWLRGQVMVAKGTAASYKSLTSGKCADIPDGSSGDVNVNQYTCHGGLNQLFQKTGGALVNVATGKCVAIVAGKLAQRACDGGSAQQWTFPANGTIRNPASNSCWKSLNNTTGSQLGVAGCTGGIPLANMAWSSPAGDPTCAP